MKKKNTDFISHRHGFDGELEKAARQTTQPQNQPNDKNDEKTRKKRRIYVYFAGNRFTMKSPFGARIRENFGDQKQKKWIRFSFDFRRSAALRRSFSAFGGVRLGFAKISPKKKIIYSASRRRAKVITGDRFTMKSSLRRPSSVENYFDYFRRRSARKFCQKLFLFVFDHKKTYSTPKGAYNKYTSYKPSLEPTRVTALTVDGIIPRLTHAMCRRGSFWGRK